MLKPAKPMSSSAASDASRRFAMHAALHDAEQGSRRFAGVVRAVAAQRPAHRQLHGGARLGLARRVRRALIEAHRDVRGEHALNAHRFLRGQKHLRAVDWRTKSRAFLGDFAHVLQAPDLKSARIGENGAAPMHEAMQPPMRLDHRKARPQIKMEGVAEDDFDADLLELFRRHRLDRSVGAHRHERGRLDVAPREAQAAAPRRAVLAQQLEPHAGLRAQRSSNAGSAGVKNIASP